VRKIHGIINIFRTEFPRSYFWINCKSSRRLSFPIFIPSLISVIAMKCCLFSPLYRRDPDRNLFDTYIYVNTAYTGLQNTAEPTLLPGADRLPSPGQNAWKSGQNQWKSGQTTWNYGQRWRPTMFDFEKLTPNMCRITWRPFLCFFGGHPKTKCLWSVWGGYIRTKSCLKTFPASLAKFGQNCFALPKFCLLLHLCV